MANFLESIHWGLEDVLVNGFGMRRGWGRSGRRRDREERQRAHVRRRRPVVEEENVYESDDDFPPYLQPRLPAPRPELPQQEAAPPPPRPAPRPQVPQQEAVPLPHPRPAPMQPVILQHEPWDVAVVPPGPPLRPPNPPPIRQQDIAPAPAPRPANAPDRPQNVLAPEIENCGICIEPYNKRAFNKPCNHAFCFSCIQEWVIAKIRAGQGSLFDDEGHAIVTCPTCRAEVKEVHYNGNRDVYRPAADGVADWIKKDRPEMVQWGGRQVWQEGQGGMGIGRPGAPGGPRRGVEIQVPLWGYGQNFGWELPQQQWGQGQMPYRGHPPPGYGYGYGG